MKSGVKRHFFQQRSQNKNVLAAQDDRPNGVRRDRRSGCLATAGRLRHEGWDQLTVLES
jgi:hypothetical protein